MINFKHLHYFWVVAKSGGLAKASEQLHTTPQTLSGQIKLLEDRLGHPLFRKAGRRLELTEDGRAALRYADEIFGLGLELERSLKRERDPENSEALEDFRVGIEDAVAKDMAYRLLLPALQLQHPRLRLVCVEGQFPDLMGQLALHRLDLVLSDEPLGSRLSIKAFNHRLGTTGISFLASPALAATLKGTFPNNVNGAPLLLPGGSSSVRPQIEAWLERHHLAPRVVAEFNDSALMKAFGRQGHGIFITPTAVEASSADQHDAVLLGRTPEITDSYYAITTERRIKHAGVAAIMAAARDHVFTP